ncbi:uncharacterized protein [Chironomus tepperi]|uniref:uncharacterized protein n=1 Tax=Chironomus tepperi TaxID=113505 RepID=UPI00391F27BF
MDDNLKLTPAEEAAKSFVLNLLLKGFQPSERCDVSFTEDMYRLPDFYDDAKFKRGQKYFMDNRFGIMQSNLYGLFSLICEPNGAKLLDKTNHSSNATTARKRYADTTFHMLSWCTDPLKPGSKSWESLKRVRLMHLAASNASLQRTNRGIPQTFMTFTTFGFMGYALVKPHLLAIRHDCQEDREAYVHLWAVIGSMLGIKDEYNMCLQKMEVVELICHILIRYNFSLFLQMETRTFEKLGRAFIEGLKWYIPFSTYEARLFQARRLAGIPGYQYDVDVSKEFHLRQIFTKAELERIKVGFQNVKDFEYRRNLVFDENMYLIDIKRMSDSETNNDHLDYNSNTYGTYKKLDTNQIDINDKKSVLMDLLDLKYPSELEITEVNDSNLSNYLNDRKFKELSKSDQMLVKISIHQLKVTNNFVLRPLIELTLSSMLSVMSVKETCC